MTIAALARCLQRGCIHYHGLIGPAFDPTHICMAYPTGIPSDILDGLDDHIVSRGDDDEIVFQPGGTLVTNLKHLPGRHDQESHTPRLYIGGHPITSAFFNDGGSELVKDLPPDLKRTVEDALIHYGVTEEELTDLEGFVSKPLSGYTYDEYHSYFTDPDDPDRQVLGLYDPDTRQISIAPMMAYRADGGKVVLHEVGHHVAIENPIYKNKRAAAGFVKAQLRHKGVGPVEAIDYGLREYSFTDDDEFLADTYTCLKAGNEVQRRNLDAAYAEIGFREGMAGVLKQVLQANELISFERDGVIQTVSVPVVISDRQAYETPWYYTDIHAEEQLVKLASLLGRWKHLPGRHDQKSHAPKTKASTGPAMRSWSGRGWDYLDESALGHYAQGVAVQDSSGKVAFGEVFGKKALVNEVSARGGEIFPESEAALWKMRVMDNLASDTGLRDERVNELIRTWAASSNDNYPTSLGLQQAASDVFGVPLTSWQKKKIKSIFDDPDTDRLEEFDAAVDDGKKLLAAMYKRTQDSFRDAGIKSVVLYRGSGLSKAWKNKALDEGTDHSVETNALGSWSLSVGVASVFAEEHGANRGSLGIVVQAEVPVERILCTPKTGLGCLAEFEYVVLGSSAEDTAKLVRVY